MRGNCDILPRKLGGIRDLPQTLQATIDKAMPPEEARFEMRFENRKPRKVESVAVGARVVLSVHWIGESGLPYVCQIKQGAKKRHEFEAWSHLSLF